MTPNSPWRDLRWLPGVLNKDQMIALMDAYILQNAKKDIEDDASALDLHLSDEAYKMTKGSIKPFNKNYQHIIGDKTYATKLPLENGDTFSLEVGNCYLIKIKERLNNNAIKNTPIYGQATAKSSVGRLDVIARLIVDGMKEYEMFVPSEVGSGEMFLEITPITFNVKVKVDTSISQLRFFYGRIEDSIINDEGFINSVLNLQVSEINHGTLSVDISNFNFPNGVAAAAFRAKTKLAKDKSSNTFIELWGKDKYEASDYWHPESCSEVNGDKSFGIDPNEFYILRSKERISLPEGVCIYCRAMDETLGEMRIHYAGFVHPYFGLVKTAGSRPGTPLIFEVRGHNVRVLLTQGEILARLFFYRMSIAAKKEFSNSTGNESATDYGNQELTLSKFFRPFGQPISKS